MTNSGFNYTKLPKYVKQYWQMIRNCLEYDITQEGKIGYLTIQESTVEPNKSHRRPGLHIETPGMVTIGGNTQLYIKGGGDVQTEEHTRVTWGGGCMFLNNIYVFIVYFYWESVSGIYWDVY